MNQSSHEPLLKGNKLLLISILSGLLWVVLGFLIIHYYQSIPISEVFRGKHFLLQILAGLITGSSIGFAGVIMIRQPSFRRILDEYAIIRQVKELSMTPKQMVYVSLVAGITEEFLFRGAIQPIIGIWWTSLLFIGIHGYIRAQSTTHILYTLFTFILSTVLGVLFIYVGLVSAMAAHFIYDVIVLYGIKEQMNP